MAKGNAWGDWESDGWDPHYFIRAVVEILLPLSPSYHALFNQSRTYLTKNGTLRNLSYYIIIRYQNNKRCVL